MLGGLLLVQQLTRAAATSVEAEEEEEVSSSSSSSRRGPRGGGGGPRMQLAGDSADGDPELSKALSSLRRLYYSEEEEGSARGASAAGGTSTGAASAAAASSTAGLYSALPLVTWRFPLLPQTQTVLNVWQPLDEEVRCAAAAATSQLYFISLQSSPPPRPHTAPSVLGSSTQASRSTRSSSRPSSPPSGLGSTYMRPSPLPPLPRRLLLEVSAPSCVSWRLSARSALDGCR